MGSAFGLLRFALFVLAVFLFLQGQLFFIALHLGELFFLALALLFEGLFFLFVLLFQLELLLDQLLLLLGFFLFGDGNVGVSAGGRWCGFDLGCRWWGRWLRGGFRRWGGRWRGGGFGQGRPQLGLYRWRVVHVLPLDAPGQGDQQQQVHHQGQAQGAAQSLGRWRGEFQVH